MTIRRTTSSIQSVSFVLACMLLAACTTQPATPEQQTETSECMNYRAMMTAPMPPDAMQRLHKACQDSMAKQRTSP